MLRRTAFAGITGLCLLAACGDDEGTGFDDEVGGGAGVGGARAGAPSGGRAGGPRGGSGDGLGGGEADAGDPGRGGSSPAEAGAPSEVDGGSPSTGSGGSGEAGQPTTTAGSGGTAGTAGTGPTTGGRVDPGTVGGAGGAGGSEDEVVGGAGGDAGTSEPEPVGLVAHFTFNDATTGETAADATGHFGPATLKSGATWTIGRAATGGVELAADGAHVQLPANLFAGVNKATIALWVNLTSLQPWSRIYDFNNGTNRKFMYLASDRFDRDVAQPGGAPPLKQNQGMLFAIHTGDPAQEGVVSTDFDLPLSVWKHVAVTIDGAEYSMFVDGSLISRGETKERFPAEIEPTLNGWLGKSTFSGDAYLKAKLDDFRVYDVVLSQAEIQDLAWPDSDYSHYRFEDTTEGEAVDYSDRAFNGTIRNGAGFTEGRVGRALLLEGGPQAGAHHYVTLPPTIVESCDDLTIALWAKPNAITNWSRFLEIDGLVDGNMFLTPFAHNGTNNELRFDIYRGNTLGVQLIAAEYPAGTTLTGVWHHYAVTLSGDTARLYFDGSQIASKTDMTFNPSDITIGANGRAWIGKANPAFNDPHLNAAIDDLRISCRAYTADEIKMLAR